MPPRTFAILIIAVIAAAGATIALAMAAGLPLVALGFATLAASLILGWRGLRK